MTIKLAVDCAQVNDQTGQAPKIANTPEQAAPGPVMTLIAGPCLIESRDHCLRMADALAEIVRDLPVKLIFKASMEKANRTRFDSPRRMVCDGEHILRAVERMGIQCLTDYHDVEYPYLDISWAQIPALLSRQSDIIEYCAVCAGSYGRKGINIKKGQFMAPHDVKYAVEKAKKVNPDCHVMVTERGYSFGYNNLVVDFRSIPIMKATSGADEVLFDCTHSVQLPSGDPVGRSGGQREFIEPLARAAICSGADGLFCEVHDNPAEALSDGPCQIPLYHFSDFLKRMLELYEWQRTNPSSSFPLA